MGQRPARVEPDGGAGDFRNVEHADDEEFPALGVFVPIAAREVEVGRADALSQVAKRANRRGLDVRPQMFKYGWSFGHGGFYHIRPDRTVPFTVPLPPGQEERRNALELSGRFFLTASGPQAYATARALSHISPALESHWREPVDLALRLFVARPGFGRRTHGQNKKVLM